MANPLPDTYKAIPDEELVERIQARKAEYGDSLTILGHHYQRREIVALADHRGDSYALSKVAAEQKSVKYIVFCGVRFMAEAAEILASQYEDKIVLHPDRTAGCPMADMADRGQVEVAWKEMTTVIPAESVIPVTYINSDANLKAFCGKHGGTVCTSSNAGGAFDWARERGERIFFFPDEHLGRNTGNVKGVPKERMILWDPAQPMGGNTEEAIRNSEVILWKGYCHVHTWFTVDMIQAMRKEHPGIQVVVHPECPEEVVAAADANGSTGYIVKYVEKAPAGSTITIGTEINLITRLGDEHPDKTIIPLSRSLCPNMWKVSLNDLAWTLDNIDTVNHVTLPAEIKTDALAALHRMLEIQ
jgi:quinolinate synthase